MKLLKFLMKTIIIFIVLIFFFGIFTSIKLKREHQKVTEVWTMFDKSLKQRDSIIVTLSTFENLDSIIFYIEKSILEREKHGKTLDFQFYEYKINEFIMLDSMITSVMINLHKELNFNVYAYNRQARSFNEDYSIFPNILVAKLMKLKREKFFPIKYGQENKDPIVESKEIPDWAKDVDISFIKENE